MTFVSKHLEPMSVAQHVAFEQVAIGNDRHIRARTAAALVRKGYIVECKRIATRASWTQGKVTLKRYEVPVFVHMEWCDWCSRHP